MELQMYEDILPALEEQNSVLFLDYAQTRGYSVANTPNGLERPTMEAVIWKLAAYHAATARYIQMSSDKKCLSGGAGATDAAAAGELKSLLQLRFHDSTR
ncbi:uncharacterized protein LOC121404755 isoform X2 [Drosophila obscura]|uniref:uncharacterized protein LOC121404755 isoform X2 n=1 Tax=Drosophila obscura TaxID=7282 RepID=UPI001BB23DDF|nr:uncharacterized protein LOC121404755 isoform X2 [Drosophila obscura]